MQRRNICKFTSPSCPEDLVTTCFVLQTDQQVMQTPKTLLRHRIMLVNEGDGDIVIDKEILSLNRGTLLFCFPGEQVHISRNGNIQYLYIDFEGLRAEALLNRFHINPNNRCFTGFDGLVPLWEESLLRASDHTIDLASESMILYTFSRFSDETSQCDSIISRIMLLTEEQFNNFELSIGTIADELGYNAKYLSHLFKQKTNKSYTEYLRCIRMKYAVTLFDNGIDSIKNVALLSGFSDPLYFSAVFKRAMGISPKEYILKNNKQRDV